MSLPSKPRVLVTGCSTGIGRALVLELHSRGCIVLATARKVEVLVDLKSMGVSTASVDVCKPETIAAALAEFGPVDVCFANAGVSFFGPLVEQPLGRISSIMDTNVTGVIATVQAVVPAMIARRTGAIVVTGSVSGAMVTPFAGAYCASKAAVSALCEALTMELDPFGVAVVNVITGSVQSSFAQNADGSSGLAPTSVYAKVDDALKARVWASQSPSACVTAEAYAKQVVDAALSPRPPAVLVAGGKAPLYNAIGQYMPRSVRRRLLPASFGMARLGTGRSGPPTKLTIVGDKACAAFVALLALTGTRAVGTAAFGVVLWALGRIAGHL